MVGLIQHTFIIYDGFSNGIGVQTDDGGEEDNIFNHLLCIEEVGLPNTPIEVVGPGSRALLPSTRPQPTNNDLENDVDYDVLAMEANSTTTKLFKDSWCVKPPCK